MRLQNIDRFVEEMRGQFFSAIYDVEGGVGEENGGNGNVQDEERVDSIEEGSGLVLDDEIVVELGIQQLLRFLGDELHSIRRNVEEFEYQRSFALTSRHIFALLLCLF